jgi:PRTRC genetic system protein A
MPLHGTFTPLDKDGHRFLLGKNGTFIEVRRNWLHAIWPDGEGACAAKPYGTVDKVVTLAFGTIPAWVTSQFAQDAKASGNVEIAACVIWDAHTRSLHYRRCETITASRAHIQYRRPALAAHESLVIDLHSHGLGNAFFSGQDDKDDCGEVKIAGVIGNVNGVPTWKFRLCLLGMFINVPIPEAVAAASQMTDEVM